MWTRAWRAWRRKVRLLAPLRKAAGGYLAPDLRYEHLSHAGGAAALPPYDGLAAVWDDYAGEFVFDYTTYLADLARDRGSELSAVLDLACGTGAQTARLAGLVPRVVGLDTSESMLARARVRCAGFSGVELVQGDFRDFRLGRRFDAVVCAADSLNYVADAGDLARVFECVAGHLEPGGVFAFDTSTEVAFRGHAGLYYHDEASGRRVVIKFAYDADRRQGTAEVILASGVETHRRTPIDPADVLAAVRGTDLVVEDYFYSAAVLGRGRVGPRCFFVLRRAG